MQKYLLELKNLNQEHESLLPRLEKLNENISDMNRGISLLSVRSQLLLSYITNLVVLNTLKLTGKSISHPARDSLIENRVFLEKTKPLEQKLKYQIDKLVKQAVIKQDREKQDILMFKPNPELMQDDEKEVEEEKDDSQVYRPPQVAPVPYEPTKNKSKKMTRIIQEKASRSRLLNDLRQDYDDRPEELDADGTGYSSRQIGASKEDDEQRERIEFEEENMVRLSMTRKDKKRENFLRKQGGLHRFKNEFQDIQSDFANLAQVHEIVEDEFKHTKKRRVDERFEDANDMIAFAGRVRKSQGKDEYAKQKRIIKKRGKK